MSGPDFAWEQAPDAAMEAFDERLRLIEILLDPHIGNADKRAERRRYCEQHRVGERTIRGYLHRYRKKGPRGLLFYRPRPTSPRVHDPGLRAKLLALVNELPTRSVPQLRKLLATDDQLGSKINRISDRTIYRFLAEQGLTQAVRYRMLAEDSRSSYRSFEAPHSLALVQADARDGIWLDTPQGRKKTYLFLWIDDFSRKILFGKYYFDEKLPALMDSFRYCVLRYGVPVRCYVDNGRVYISRHLLAILVELQVKRVRHPPYQSYCKGKVEAGLPADHRRITDLETFNALFLWRERRTVTKYGRIKLHGNQYPVTAVPHGSVVEVRFDPYDLAQLAIYEPGGARLETTSASKQVTRQVPAVPEESRAKPPEVSAAARDYFTRLREQHHAQLRDRNQTSFTQLHSTDQEHHDADA